MTGRGRRAPLVAVAAAALVSAVAAPSGAATGRVARPHVVRGQTPSGFAVVQYAQGNGLAPWGARLLATARAQTAAASGPRAAPDADGGTQVAYRNPEGDAIWLDGSGLGPYASVDLTSVTGIAPLASQPVPVVGPHGRDEVFCVTRSSHLLLLTWDPYRRVPEGPLGISVPRADLWTRTDVTQLGGPPVTGTPSVVVTGGQTSVFARDARGDLVEYVNDGLRGHRWNGYDLTVIAGGPRLASDPAAFYDPATQQVRVAATELGPHRGDVVVFTPNDVGGRVWTVDDVTHDTTTAPVEGGVAAVLYGGAPTLLGATVAGDLVELVGSDQGLTTRWAATDVSTATPGSPSISGTPSASVSGSRLAVAAVAAAWGDLFEWTSVAPGGPFTVTDLSNSGQGTTRTVAGSPSAVFVDGALSIFTAGVAQPAPEGTGVYAVPERRWSTAISDGWPILGVTGGLGSRCAPWVVLPDGGSVQPDEQVGAVIQASHVRETWLSFWTVSGAGTTPSSQCAGTKGPVTPKAFYAHGYAAGRYVATLIDAYHGAGLGLKPDWVIFDPEGYPDNHSGLWGPTSPPSKLNQSIASWYAILGGWRNGLSSVDPSLKAGLYANQYEYMTYQLYGQPLPTFIAGAFSETVVGGKRQLEVPTRTAFGPNIVGFAMFNSFNPTCAQVNVERLLLAAAPWNGSYNTLQLPPGRYCPPGPSG